MTEADENKEMVKTAEKVREELERALEKWFGLEGEKEVGYWYVWAVGDLIIVNERKLLEVCMFHYILDLNDPDPSWQDMERASINKIIKAFGYEFMYDLRELAKLTADDMMYYAKKLVCKREMDKIIKNVMKEYGYLDLDSYYKVYVPREVYRRLR